MKDPTFSKLITCILLLIFFCSFASADHDFLECFSRKIHNKTTISNIVYTPQNPSYTSVLRFLIQYLTFTTPSTPKPQVIITPEHEFQIPTIIYCAKRSNLEIRTRSGGHDFEGLSYRAQVPFLILDLLKLSEITVDVDSKTAWVGSGANVGSLYYRIAEKSPVLGFPAGMCTSLGIGGHLSGGGFGTLLRKYGMAADHVLDARIVDVKGRILDRKSMGEDLFWAIRGGGGASFGVITAWKLRLVDVPEKVTVFIPIRTLEQNMTQLVHRWQSIAHKFDKDLLVRIGVRRINTNQLNGRNFTMRAAFSSVFFGGVDRLLPLMQESFPELGLVREDCTEMSWIRSVIFFASLPRQSPLEVLLNRTNPFLVYFKGKSDYMEEPIPVEGLEGMWRLFSEPDAAGAAFTMTPYGGRMAEIPESSIPFPHRGRNIYGVEYGQTWDGTDTERYLAWHRKFYNYMGTYASKSPRSAYVNYRDLDIGVNRVKGKTSYKQASVWGKKYFRGNFDRLVRVKAAVDPKNFFRNEQSIPPYK